MNVRDIVRGFILENFYVQNAHELGDDTSLLDRGIVDSTGVLEVTAFLEERFGLAVADAEIVPENLDSIGAIVAFVGRKRGRGAGAVAKESDTCVPS